MTHRRRAWLAEATIIAALMLLPLLFWWRLWAFDPSDRAVIPEGDFSSQYYPLQLFAARELAEGRLPAWNPYINAGQPGLADIQTGTFYPLNLVPNLILGALGLSLTLERLTAQVVLHFSLASLFTYLFVRHLARRAGARTPAARFAGAVAALSYVASECDADLEKLCSSVQAGEGRLLQCLEKKDKEVSGRCKEALKEVGLK